MKKKSKGQKGLNRRKFLPILGSGLLLPLLPTRANTTEAEKPEEIYKTLLKPDGTTVRVKISRLKQAKVIKKQISNSELLDWLDPDKANG